MRVPIPASAPLRRGLVLLTLCVLPLGAACGSESNDPLQRALDAHADGRLEDAAEGYRDVLNSDPTNKYAHYNIGLIDQTAGRNDSAAGSYRRALEADPRFVPALFNLAVLLTKNDADEAIDLYERVIDVQPNHASAHLNLGFLLKEEGNEAEGNDHLEKAVELDPKLESRIPGRARPEGPATPAP